MSIAIQTRKCYNLLTVLKRKTSFFTNCFENLDAPVVRCGSLDTPVPMNADIEWNFLPKARFEEALLKLWKY